MNSLGLLGGWPACADDWRPLSLRSPLVYVHCGGSPPSAVAGALAGGVGMVLYQPRSQSDSAAVMAASQLVWLCRAVKVPLLIQSRVHVALAALADGVHLGPDDIPAVIARPMMGPAAVIGATCHSPAHIREAVHSGANYVSFGPLIAPGEHADADIAQLRRLARSRQLAICLNGEAGANLAQLQRPEDLVAVSDAISQAANPRRATEELVAVMRTATTASRTADEAACRRSGTTRPPNSAPVYRPPYAIPPAENQ